MNDGASDRLLPRRRGDFYFLLFGSVLLEFMYFPRLAVWQELVRERFPRRSLEESS